MTYRPEMSIFWALYAVVSMQIFATAWILSDDLRDAWQLAFGVWVAVTALFFWRALVSGGGE
jgi:hypothetical protein